VLPVLRAQHSGHVLFVSSVATRMAFPGMAAYTAARCAPDGLAATPAVEVAPFGVRVTALQPGRFSTGYGRGVVEPATRVAAYGAVTGRMLAGVRGRAHSADAGFVCALVDAAEVPSRLPIGADAWGFARDAREREAADLVRAALAPTA
jgi:NAD(P)-dependent dehydrogenase (short-subunit alcohol dehydrogenase family)